MVHESIGRPLDSGYCSKHMWRRICFIALVLPPVLLWRVSALAETLTVAKVNGLSVSYKNNDHDHCNGSHSLSRVSKDDTFALRDPSDPVVYEYKLTAQASADLPFYQLDQEEATVSGNVKFNFNLPDVVSLWDIAVNYELHGVVAVDVPHTISDEGARVRGVKPSGTGVVSSLGTTSIPGATQWGDKGAKHIDGQRVEQVTGIAGVNAPGSVSFAVDVYAQSWADPLGGLAAGEAYASLGKRSPLKGFDLDNTYYDSTDGLKVTLTFTPHLNLSGHSLESDLALAGSETLSGYGTWSGDVSGVAGSEITSSSGELMVGDPFSATGFETAGNVEAVGGTLLVYDADAAVFGGRTHISGIGTLKVPGDLQNDGVIAIDGGVLDVGGLTGAGSLEWTQGKLKSTAVTVGPGFGIGESLAMSSSDQELVADMVTVETGGSLTVAGGTVFGNVDAWNGSELNISGGSVALGYGPSGRPNRLSAHRDSNVNLFGTEFVLDGTDITTTLNPNVSLVIDDRDVIFSGLLADGSPFSFDLEYFSPSATLTVTLVPEPSSFALLVGLIVAVMSCRRRVAAPC